MARSYSIFEIEKFPEIKEGSPFIVPFQSMLAFNSNQIKDPPVTEVEAIGTIPKLNTQVLRITHEIIVNQPGRVFGERFNQFVGETKFPAYYFQESRLLFLKANKRIAKSAMTILLRADEIDGKQKILILDSIRPYIDKLKGAWFKVADSADVTSQALYGPSIDQDVRFDRAMDEGEMNHVRLDYSFRGERIHIGISSDSSISVLSDNLDEQSELELILDVKKELLDLAKVKP